jgi:hypothetical protein
MTLDGQFTKLIQIPASLGWAGGVSPDDKAAYVFGRNSSGAYNSLVAVDLTTGEQKTLFSAAGGAIMTAAVDRVAGRIAFLSFSPTKETKLATIQADGTGYRELYVTSKQMGNAPDQVQWTADGRYLFFIEDGRVMRIPADAGKPEFTGVGAGTGSNRAIFISLRPDGSRIAYSAGAPLSGTYELWSLDNLTSLLKTQK